MASYVYPHSMKEPEPIVDSLFPSLVQDGPVPTVNLPRSSCLTDTETYEEYGAIFKEIEYYPLFCHDSGIDLERLLHCVQGLPFADRDADYMHSIRSEEPLDSDKVAFIIPKVRTLQVVKDGLIEQHIDEGALFPAIPWYSFPGNQYNAYEHMYYYANSNPILWDVFQKCNAVIPGSNYNHMIVKRYVDENDNIPWHYDKTGSGLANDKSFLLDSILVINLYPDDNRRKLSIRANSRNPIARDEDDDDEMIPHTTDVKAMDVKATDVKGADVKATDVKATDVKIDARYERILQTTAPYMCVLYLCPITLHVIMSQTQQWTSMYC